jgi:peptide chain release factor 2
MVAGSSRSEVSGQGRAATAPAASPALRYPLPLAAGALPWIDVAADFSTVLDELNTTLSSIEAVLDVDRLRREVAELEQQAAAPDLWDDVEAAQALTSRLSYLQGDLRRVEELRSRLDDVGVLHELAVEEDDAATIAEAERELDSLRKAIDELEVRTLLSGEYDSREALVTIRSEAGGVDAADFAEMLMRMYMRWAERHKYPVEMYDVSYAEEAGIKSATFAVKVPYAYGTLSVEQGTHRLVRISPFDNQGRRQTSFAGVEVLPVVEQTDHVEIPENEIKVDVFRSSGPGGQSVNTTDSAVRMTHLPTGIVVSCQNEKSQIQNRAAALRVLQARLLVVRQQEQKAELDALKGEGSSWGNQMRSYVLHPYQMVKDLRTEQETGNTTAVLDGDIDSFIEAGIRWRRQQETVPAG